MLAMLGALAGCQQRPVGSSWPDRQVSPSSAEVVQARLQVWFDAPATAPLALSEADLTALLRAVANPQATAWLQDGQLYVQSAAPDGARWQATILFGEHRPFLRLAALTCKGYPLPRPLRYLAQAAANAALADLILPLKLTGIHIHAGELILTVAP